MTNGSQKDSLVRLAQIRPKFLCALSQNISLCGAVTLAGLLIVSLLARSSSAQQSAVEKIDFDTLSIGTCQLKRTYHQGFDRFAVTPHQVIEGSWTAHTPWNGDFGDASFVDPRPGFPFTTDKGTLRIEARKVGERWYSGLISSIDREGNGFAKQYGYFEVQAQLPQGKGLWPAIWLTSKKPAAKKDATVEIDLIEHYGQFPDKFNTVVHSWAPEAGEHVRPVASHIQDVEKGSLYTAFRFYGVDVEPDWITFYYERREFWRTATPQEHKYPLGILIDLALGSGWPIDEAPSPSLLSVRSVDVYERAERC